MGQNPQNQCFVVGFDGNCPEKPHHRSSSCPASGDCSNGSGNPGPNPMVSSEISFYQLSGIIFTSKKYTFSDFIWRTCRWSKSKRSIYR